MFGEFLSGSAGSFKIDLYPDYADRDDEVTARMDEKGTLVGPQSLHSLGLFSAVLTCGAALMSMVARE